MKKYLLLLSLSLTLILTSCGISAFDDPNAGIDGPYGHLTRTELVAADTAGKGSAGQLFGELVSAKVSEITQGRLTIDYHPNGDLGGDADLLRQVQCGGIDIVVCQTAPVASTYIGEHQIVLLVPLSHQLARYEEVDLRELDGEDFIAFDTDCQLRGVTDQIFQELSIQPNITMETAQDLIIYGLVAASHGAAIIPYPLGGAPYNTKILRISNDIPPRRLYLQWNKEQYLPPAAEYFRDFVIRSGEVFTQFLHKNGQSLTER